MPSPPTPATARRSYAYVQHTFGSLGSSFLAGLIALACLVTAVGLTCACAEYFCQRLPLSYRSLVIILAGFSFIVSNLGLTKLIQVRSRCSPRSIRRASCWWR